MPYKITVKIEGDYLVFMDGKAEIYDIDVAYYSATIELMRLKIWFTQDVENDCTTLLAGRNGRR